MNKNKLIFVVNNTQKTFKLSKKWLDLFSFFYILYFMKTKKLFNKYTIDENGDIFNEKSEKLKSFVNNTGYKRIGLQVDGKSKKFLVHLLVAQAFLKNTKNKKVVSFKDDDKTNTHYTNLLWSDQFKEKYKRNRNRKKLLVQNIINESKKTVDQLEKKVQEIEDISQKNVSELKNILCNEVDKYPNQYQALVAIKCSSQHLSLSKCIEKNDSVKMMFFIKKFISLYNK